VQRLELEPVELQGEERRMKRYQLRMKDVLE